MSDAGFTLQALWALRDDRSLGEAEWKVAMALVSFCDERGVCRPSVRRLAEVARTSRSGVQRALRELATSQGPISVQVTARVSEHGDPDTRMYQLSLKGWPHTAPTPPHAAPTGPQGKLGVAPQKAGGGPTQHPGVAPQRATKRTEEEDTEEDTEEDKRVRAAFDYWHLKLWGKVHGTKAKLTPSRRKHFAARIRDGFSDDQIRAAIDNVAADKFMLGENDRGRTYIEPENFMRTEEKLSARLSDRKPTPAKGVRPVQQGFAPGVQLGGNERLRAGGGK